VSLPGSGARRESDLPAAASVTQFTALLGYAAWLKRPSYCKSDTGLRPAKTGSGAGSRSKTLCTPGADPDGINAVLTALGGESDRLVHDEAAWPDPLAPERLVGHAIERLGTLDALVINHARGLLTTSRPCRP
jgi:hypothetical protein